MVSVPQVASIKNTLIFKVFDEILKNINKFIVIIFVSNFFVNSRSFYWSTQDDFNIGKTSQYSEIVECYGEAICYQYF